MSMWRLVSWKFYLVSTVNSIALFQCKDGTSPRKDLDTRDVSLVVIMMARVLRSMQRTVPQNLTPDMRVAGKTSFYLWIPKLGWLYLETQSTLGITLIHARCFRNVMIMWSKGGMVLWLFGNFTVNCSPFSKIMSLIYPSWYTNCQNTTQLNLSAFVILHSWRFCVKIEAPAGFMTSWCVVPKNLSTETHTGLL